MGKKILYSFLLTALLAITASYCFSKEDATRKTTFSDLIATTSETHLLLFGVVDNSFTKEMISSLQSGVPIDFTFFVDLYQKGKTKETPRQLTQLEFRHVMTYDTLKESYRVELGEANNKIVHFQSLARAKKTMSEINGLKVLELSRLIPDNTYQLKIRAELFEKTLPMGLRRYLPFLSWWDRETDWQTIEFNY